MKQNSLRAICLIVMACIAVLSAFGDDRPPIIESKVLETFNDEDRRFWNGEESPYEWRLQASRFAAEGFPRMTYVPEYPLAFFGPNRDLRSFGIWGQFDRRGHNWVDILPFEAGADEDASATTIPIPGRLQFIDMWVWGANFRYDLEAYFRDYRGMIHVVRLGRIDHRGWRNMRVAIPNNIPQTRLHLISRQAIPEDRVNLAQLAGLEFIKFRVWTDPTERVDNFFIYFNQFRIITDMHDPYFDGDTLANPSWIQEQWGGGE